MARNAYRCKTAVKAMRPTYGGTQMAIVTMWEGKDWLVYSQSTRNGHSSEVFQMLSFWAPPAQLRQWEQYNKAMLSMRGHGPPCRELQERTKVHPVRIDRS